MQTFLSIEHAGTGTLQFQLPRGAAQRELWRRGTVLYVHTGRVELRHFTRVAESTMRVCWRLNEGDAHTVEFDDCYELIAERDATIFCLPEPSVWHSVRRFVRHAVARCGLSARSTSNTKAAGP